MSKPRLHAVTVFQSDIDAYLRRNGASPLTSEERQWCAAFYAMSWDVIDAGSFIRANRRQSRGFTLIELAIVCVILGTLAAIGIPAYANMVDRAREGATRANMHTFQLMAESYMVDHDGLYASDAYPVAGVDGTVISASADGSGDGDAPGTLQSLTTIHDSTPFDNPWTHRRGIGEAWENRADENAGPTAHPGIVSYSGHGDRYSIKGEGKHGPLPLILTPGVN